MNSRHSSDSIKKPFCFVCITFLVLLLAVLVIFFDKPDLSFSQEPIMSGVNVFKKPLALFSRQPMTGFYRDGYCRSGAADFGNHAVAAVVTEEFLDYSASQGNDLRVAGLTEGCKWCLCTSRWLEAFDAFKDGKISDKGVPKVHLQATDESALKKVDLDVFKKFAVDAD